MPEAVPLLNYAAHALARAAHGLREVERRRSDGEARGGEAEVAGDQPVGHLVVARPADAVDELIGEEHAHKHRQRQRARREAEIVLPQPLGQLSSQRGGFRRRLQ